MSSWLVAHESMVRLISFAFVFALMAIAEAFLEARPLRVARRRRWTHNLGLTLLNTLVLRLLFPAGATATALWASKHGLGLLRLVPLPPVAEIAIGVTLLDLAIYGQHRLFHAVPLLFRFHQVHHADNDFDVTLGSRFHPIEMLLSMAIKIAAVVLLGASAAAVVLFETILAVTSLFSHSNIRLPRTLDRVLRLVMVTPAMHVVHHSADRADRDTNFGFAIPWWDRLFRTYRDHAVTTLGMPEHRFQLRQTLRWMLALPFVRSLPAQPAPSERHRQAA